MLTYCIGYVRVQCTCVLLYAAIACSDEDRLVGCKDVYNEHVHVHTTTYMCMYTYILEHVCTMYMCVCARVHTRTRSIVGLNPTQRLSWIFAFALLVMYNVLEAKGGFKAVCFLKLPRQLNTCKTRTL